MILNNLFYITAKVRLIKKCTALMKNTYKFANFMLQFADSHPRNIEMLWGTLCQYWPNNLKVVLRYLVIVVGLAPTELISCVSFTLSAL